MRLRAAEPPRLFSPFVLAEPEPHADLRLSLADASIAVLAVRHKVNDVLTLDERHFRVLTPGRSPFRVLPADA